MSELVTDSEAAEITLRGAMTVYQMNDLLHTRAALIEALERVLTYSRAGTFDEDDGEHEVWVETRQLLATIHAKGEDE